MTDPTPVPESTPIETTATANPTLVHVDKVKFTRAWNDLSTKVKAALASGVGATIIIATLHAFGIDLDPVLAAGLTALCGFAGGYTASESTTTATVSEEVSE